MSDNIVEYGYGVVVNGKLDLRTVGPTRRSAMVNGLVLLLRAHVPDSATDAQIATAWNTYAPNIPAKIYRVECTALVHAIEA